MNENILMKKYLNKKIKIHYIDMKCPINKYGYPDKNGLKENWFRYSDIIKKMDKTFLSKLDLIFVDGRFRVACCLKCHSLINNNCIILLNDFIQRKHYHIILNYFDIVEKSKNNNMVALKKKNNNPSIELIKKFELIPE